MDPLSLAASIVGLLAAGVRTTAFLQTLASNAQCAPQLAQSLIIEISGIEVAASSLQEYTSSRAQISTERGSLILVVHVLTTLTGCVTTYSELQTIIDDMNIGPNMSIINGLKWAAHESKLAAVVQELQNHKSSLTLMLSILQCRLMQEAEKSRRQLSNLVEEVLRTNQDLDKRMRSFETEQDFAETSSPSHTKSQHMRAPDHKGKSVMVTELPAVGFSFERDLRRSRPYNRTIKIQQSMTSLTSTARYTTAMSITQPVSSFCLVLLRPTHLCNRLEQQRLLHFRESGFYESPRCCHPSISQHRPSEKGQDHQPGNFECYICFRVRMPEHFDALQLQSNYVDIHGRVASNPRKQQPRSERCCHPSTSPR